MPLRHATCTLATLTCLIAAAPGAFEPRPLDVLQALDRWLQSYRNGKVDFDPSRNYAGDSEAVALGLIDPKSRRVTAAAELEALVHGAVRLDASEAVDRVLSIAAVGLDGRRYSPEMLPTRVRSIGERALLGFDSVATRDYLLRVARGSAALTGSSRDVLARRCAAIRTLGSLRQPVFRPILEKRLAEKEDVLRLAAAEALLRMRQAGSLAPLLDAMENERQSVVLQAMAEAAAAIVAQHQESIWPPRLARTVRTAATALGRTNWRTDMSLVKLLEATRHEDAIPALIQTLERFTKSKRRSNPQNQRAAGASKPSSMLQHRAHRALVRLTGKQFGYDRPTEWRYFWTRSKSEFVAPIDPPRPDQSELPHFFGIPIEGQGVLFAVDLSGSMDFGYRGKTTRLQIARAALIEAIRALPRQTRFDIVSFSDGAWAWSKTLQQATPANKESALQFIRDLDALGATNTWGALSSVLRMHERKYGEQRNFDVDELFLLSDGMPTQGLVIDAQAILQMVATGNVFDEVRIHSVFLAPQLNSRDQENERAMGMRARDFMLQLAEQNGGVFREQG